jgi:hypothetical protein
MSPYQIEIKGDPLPVKDLVLQPDNKASKNGEIKGNVY